MNSWTNGLLPRRAIPDVYIGFFSARLSRVNDTGFWSLPFSIRNIKICLVVIPL